MVEPTDPSALQPPTLNYSRPPAGNPPTPASAMAMVLGLLAIGFFLVLIGSVMGRIYFAGFVGVFYLWMLCAGAALVSGVRGLRDPNNWDNAGRAMSWIGVIAGTLNVAMLLVIPFGGINVTLLLLILGLALFAMKK